jgi:rubrerythrin
MDDYICKKCGYDMSNTIMWVNERGWKSKFLAFKEGSYKAFYDGSISGHRWIKLITCRHCGNAWEVRNSDI